ncbi:hypothetical protein D4R87_02215, partial [bacterium]
ANTLIKPPVHEGPLFGDEFADALGELIDEYFAPVDQLHKSETARKLQQLISNKTNKELESIIKSYSYLKDERHKQVLAQKNKKLDTERMRINNLWRSYENIFQNKPVGFFDTRYFFPAVFRKGGFDIVIGNPPYVGEKGHKEMFREIKSSQFGKEFYIRKMDLFYFFFHAGINFLSGGGVLSFITTNYYITATGAKKLRIDFKNRTTLSHLINFNELKIFESALGQHNMVTILTKEKNSDTIVKTCITRRTGYANSTILENIVGWQDDKTDYYEVDQKDIYDGDNCYIRLSGSNAKTNDPTQSILEKVKRQGVRLDSVCKINQGLLTGIDKITKKHIKNKLVETESELGNGVFVISKDEMAELSLTKKESDILFPFFKNSNIGHYSCSELVQSYVVYATRNINIEDYPNINRHFNKYKKAIQSRSKDRGEMQAALKLGKWWVIFAARDKNLFVGEKIVSPQRSYENKFAFNSSEWFASADVYFITKIDENIKLKYVLALLNSKIYYIWLYHRGKRKGEMLELLFAPLTEIPIKRISESEQKPFIEIVDKILTITKSSDYLENTAKKEKVKEYEKQIDQLVYKLYDLTPEEIIIVENSTKK